MEKYGVGQALRRREDDRFLTGQGSYTDDIAVTGQAHGFVLRSPHAHAEIVALDTETAATASGVLAVLTAADVAADGLGTLPNLAEVPNWDGAPMATPPGPCWRRVVYTTLASRSPSWSPRASPRPGTPPN